MTDKVIQYPGRYQLVPVDGTTDQFDLVAVPGTVTAAGTALNKANLLSDLVAAAIETYTGVDLPSDPTINDVFGAISQQVGVQIATGSYTGSGAYAYPNINSLVFDFAPKLLMVFHKNGAYLSSHDGSLSSGKRFILPCDVLTTSWDQAYLNCSLVSNTDLNMKKSEDGKTIYWLNATSADYQFNISSYTYYYIAIG